MTKAPNRDPVVIENQPEGELVDYDHSLSGFSFYNQEVVSGTITSKIVYAPDGETVYIKNICAAYTSNAWVSGTISGNKITVPLEQYLSYDSYNEWYMKLVCGTTTRNESDNIVFVQNPNVTEVTFTIDGDNIYLDNSSAGNNGEGAVGLAVVGEDGICYGLEWGSQYTAIPPVIIPELIYDQPEGDLASYMYTCSYYYLYDQAVYTARALSNFVYAPDGETVYIQLFDGYPWLTATIAGNKIHMPLGQYTYYDEGKDYGELLAWGTIVQDGDGVQFVQDNTVTEVTFTIQDGVITMDNSSGGNDGIGAVGMATIANDGSTCYYLEWNTTFTPYVTPTLITEQPEGELKTYNRSGYSISESSIHNQEGTVDIVYAPDGETVYIQDIFFGSDLGSWVRGTIQDGKLHLPLGQYILCGSGYNFFIGWGQAYLNNDNVLKLNYDPTVTEATFTISGNTITLDNSSLGPDNGPDGAAAVPCK